MTDHRKAHIREHIKINHQKLLKVTARLRSADFELRVYGPHDPSDWTVHSVIAHLASAASEMLQNAQTIATGEDPIQPDFDVDRWNARMVHKAAPVPTARLLDRITRSNQKWLRFLDKIPNSHLNRRGRHGRGDILTVEGFMRRYANHEAHHATEISAALQRS